jgi:ABC-type lipoprotein export system ATPase subunit
MWIELEGVRAGRRLGAAPAGAREGVSLQVGRGELVAILGPSGAGKSALLEVLGLLARPDAGSYRLDGVRVDRLPDAQRTRLRGRHVGFVFEANLLVPELSLLENVELPLVYQPLGQAERRARAAGILGEIGLGARLRRRPGELAPGERRRAAFARACAAGPELLLADEPTRGLEGREADEIMDWLDSRSALGTTVVVATRDPARGCRARRLVHLRNGQLVGELPPVLRLASRKAVLRTPRGRARWR